MEEIGHVSQLVFHLGTYQLSVNPKMFIMTWVVMGILILFGFFGGRKLRLVPHFIQTLWEMLIGFIDDLVVSAMDESGRKYVPLFTTLFLFVWVSNIISIVPGLEEPTQFLSTDLGLALMIFIFVQYSALRKRGFIGFFKHHCEPMAIMLPLNVVGELAKVVSHSFRLFGNVLGHAIMLTILSALCKNIGIPILLHLMGLLVGTIQAFVFTMLGVIYLSVAVKTEESHS